MSRLASFLAGLAVLWLAIGSPMDGFRRCAAERAHGRAFAAYVCRAAFGALWIAGGAATARLTQQS